MKAQIIHKKIFKIFPFRYYPQDGTHRELKSGWFKYAIADYRWNNGKWQFLGYSGEI